MSRCLYGNEVPQLIRIVGLGRVLYIEKHPARMRASDCRVSEPPTQELLHLREVPTYQHLLQIAADVTLPPATSTNHSADKAAPPSP
ncbi:hypothetical protein XA68_12267 [Ophiocordyceps unilateralis]|uniref:Uncharacterized protein n=1 Tax=Ophiocordyceps unilateralis TaxID=268505 RepID=A0A2A9PF21_OPHUN|nr:hypothetical protein XA68_12267 [Ophiocordyceps unilateralis]